MILEKTYSMVEELKSSNSQNDKKEVLKTYIGDSEIQTILNYVYNPLIKMQVTSDTLKKRNDLVDSSVSDNLITVLHTISTRKKTGYEAIEYVNGFIFNQDPKYHKLIYTIIDKNLEARIGSKLINQVRPETVPVFDIALAEDISKVPNKNKPNFEVDTWYASRKLDGVRCITAIDGLGNIFFYSRSGKSFLTLGRLREELEKLNLRNVVLDGELCLVDENNDENFQDVMKEIRRKDHTIENPFYFIFDMLTLDEFERRESDTILSSRLTNLHNTIPSTKYFSELEQVKVLSNDHLNNLKKWVAQEGYEGLILRKDTYYKGKRSSDLLKVKEMEDAEYEVLDVEIGTIDDGHSNKVEGLSAVIIEHKGYRVKVGSGFTYKERIHYLHHPEDIIGKIITVQYFEETTNQDGGLSLRFPVVKIIHGDKREV